MKYLPQQRCSKASFIATRLLFNCLLLIGLLGYPPYAAANPTVTESEKPHWGFGPVRAYNQYPLSALHASWSPRSPETMHASGFELHSVFTWSNTNILSEQYRVDAETRELRTTFRYGITDAFEATASVPLVWRGGGVLDPFIDGWHDFFGLPQGDRDSVPDNVLMISGETENGGPFSVSETSTQLGNVSLGTRYLFTRGSRGSPAWTGEISFSLPTSHEQHGHEGIDTTIGIVGSYRVHRSIFYWGLAYLHFADTKIGRLNYQQHHGEGFLAVEYELTHSLSLLASVIGSTETVNNVPDHPNHSLYLDTGLAARIAKHWVLEASLRENPSAGRGSTDVEFQLGFKYRESSENLPK